MITYVDVEIYHTTIVFLIETTIDEFERFYYDNVCKIPDDLYKNMRKDIEDEQCCNGFTSVTPDGSIVVFIRYADEEEDVAHEIYHAANAILCRVGVEHDDIGEPWAYLIGYLTKKYYEALANIQE